MSTSSDHVRAHGDVAACTLHWFDGECWITQDKDGQRCWSGWNASDARPHVRKTAKHPAFRPWRVDLDASDAPFYRWFAGGRTNAAFNEVDRHVLSGRGSRDAFFVEPPGEQTAGKCTYRDLLLESTIAAVILRRIACCRPYGENQEEGCDNDAEGKLGGSRIALIGANTLDQAVWIQAAKRLGIPYTCLPVGASTESCVSRVRSLGADLVYYSVGTSSSSSTLPAKKLRALCKYCKFVVVGGSLDVSLHDSSCSNPTFEKRQHPSTQPLPPRCHDAADLRRRALDLFARLSCSSSPLSFLRGQDLVRACWEVQKPVPVPSNYPLFICFTSGSTGTPKGLVHSHGSMSCVADTMRLTFGVPAPAFNTLTSKNVEKEEACADVALVVATPAWITGQSYMLSACLTRGITSVLLEGSPVSPSPTRFAEIVERRRVTLLKAGSTFLRQIMADPNASDDLRRRNLSSLRAASFCAEPVSPTVHAFAQQNICPHYVNSYWASEHGGIVFSRPYCDVANIPAASRPDARCTPVPWVKASVMVDVGSGDAGGSGRTSGRCLREVAAGERGEIVLDISRAPFPSMARTIWGDKKQFSTTDRWRGNLKLFREKYFCVRNTDDSSIGPKGELLFVQGDFAEMHEDGSFSFHGRSDDVMNIGGVRIGTGEIEAALYRHKKIFPESPLANCVVCRSTDSIKGDLPVAFLVPLPGRTFEIADRIALQNLVIESVGPMASPAYFCVVKSLPMTRTGKYMRRLLSAIVSGTDDEREESAAKARELATTTTTTSHATREGEDDDALVNPESLDEARVAVVLARRQCGSVKSNSSAAKAAALALVIELFSEISSWRDPNQKSLDHRNDGSDGAPPINQPLMHLGFDSMRLVLFRDTLLRRLPPLATPPPLLLRLFGAKGLESSTLEQLSETLSASAAGQSLLTSSSPTTEEEEGWHEGALRTATKRCPGASVLRERDLRDDDPTTGRRGQLLPRGGLEACYRGHLGTAREMVEEGRWDPRFAVCQQGSTAIHWAATGGHRDVLRWLIEEKNMDVNAKNKAGRTPLMFAAKYGHRACVEWLVEEGGANLRCRAGDDSDVFAWAVYGSNLATLDAVASHLSVSELGRTNKFGCSAIHWAAAGGDVVVLKWLHARGLSFDVVNNAGFGAVSKAAYHRHKEALRWLLLDKEGPSLLWQLQPRLDVELARKICGHSDGDETCTLEKLIVDGGWGTVDNFLKANASKVVAGTKFSYPDVRVVAARERQPKLNNIVVERV